MFASRTLANVEGAMVTAERSGAVDGVGALGCSTIVINNNNSNVHTSLRLTRTNVGITIVAGMFPAHSRAITTRNNVNTDLNGVDGSG